MPGNQNLACFDQLPHLDLKFFIIIETANKCVSVSQKVSTSKERATKKVGNIADKVYN